MIEEIVKEKMTKIPDGNWNIGVLYKKRGQGKTISGLKWLIEMADSKNADCFMYSNDTTKGGLESMINMISKSFFNGEIKYNLIQNLIKTRSSNVYIFPDIDTISTRGISYDYAFVDEISTMKVRENQHFLVELINNSNYDSKMLIADGLSGVRHPIVDKAIVNSAFGLNDKFISIG